MYLNLHAHSLYSDGHFSIAEIAKVFKAQNHAALILTDHDGLDPITTKIWQKMLDEAETVSDSIQFLLVWKSMFQALRNAFYLDMMLVGNGLKYWKQTVIMNYDFLPLKVG